MGIALWIGGAAALFLSARRVPYGRPASWIGELILSLASAAIFGLTATALDFGGWNEPDWRAGLFVFFGSATVMGAVRLVGVVGRASGVGADSGVGRRGSGVGESKPIVRSSRTEIAPQASTPSASPLPTPATTTPDTRHPAPAK